MINMVGMMWYSAGVRQSLSESISAAMAYHQNKYGKRAPICLVNFKDVEGKDLSAISKDLNVVVRAVRIVLPSHLWLGEEKVVENHD